MKRSVLFWVLVAVAMSVFSQNELQTATLQHGDEVSVFTGGDALIKAYNASGDGDVITLSGGIFSPVEIRKPITIYGAGFEADRQSGTEVTTINGLMRIGHIDSTPLTDVHLEGLYFQNNLVLVGYSQVVNTIKNFTLRKCYLNSLLQNQQDTLENVAIDQCVIMGSISHGDYNGATAQVIKNMTVRNCFLNSEIYGYNMDLSFIWVDHCISNAVYVTTYGRGRKILWTNCIFTERVTANNRGITGEFCTVKNCVARNNGFPNSIVENLYEVPEIADIFADEASNAYSPARTFELKQPSVWVGTDGTQVGLLGGNGWSKAPSVPVVKDLQLKVEGSTLKVTYEAEAR